MRTPDDTRVISHDLVMAALASINAQMRQRLVHTTSQKFAGTMIGPTVHHVGSRQACGRGARVFTHADELDDDGIVLRHLCSRCARVARGEPVCRVCGERIDETAAGWRHLNVQRRHPAAPLAPV